MSQRRSPKPARCAIVSGEKKLMRRKQGTAARVRDLFFFGAFFGSSFAAVGCAADAAPTDAAPKDGPACGSGESYGAEVGDFMQDFALRNQEGKTVRLSDFCGKVVALELGAMWCPTCQGEAEEINGLMDEYGDQGLVVLTLLTETGGQQNPETQDLKAWAETYQLETPVLADPEWRIWERYFEMHVTPRALIMGPDGTIEMSGLVIHREDLARIFDS